MNCLEKGSSEWWTVPTFCSGEFAPLLNHHIIHNTRNYPLPFWTYYIRITIIKVEPARRACGFLQSERQKQLRQRKVSCSVWQPPSCGKWSSISLATFSSSTWHLRKALMIMVMKTQQTMKMKRKIWKPGQHIESHDGLSRKNRTAGWGHWRGRDYHLFALCLHIWVFLYLFNEEIKVSIYLSLSFTSVEERGS